MTAESGHALPVGMGTRGGCQWRRAKSCDVQGAVFYAERERDKG